MGLRFIVLTKLTQEVGRLGTAGEMKTSREMVILGADEIASREGEDPYNVCQDVLFTMFLAAQTRWPIARYPLEAF